MVWGRARRIAARRATAEAGLPPATLARLQSVKRRVDPHNVFRDNIDLGRLDES
jgi:FAD/FMN-containing dehydrogenase